MKISRAAGIDLGTTNSAIALVTPRGDAVELWRDEHGRRTIPSVVGWNPDAERLAVGWEAWRQARA